MKTICEICTTTLSPEDEAFVCSYECTFCRACADARDRRCPNCGGELLARLIS